MRLVLDTNVLVAAMRSPRGASARMVDALHLGQFTAVATEALFAEWQEVLTRPEHLSAAHRTAEEVADALDELAGKIEPVDPYFSWRPQLGDADDEMVLEAAINGRAEAIVTFEVATFRAAALRFGIGVLTPAAAWRRLKP